jgi:hypothetical protein
MVGVAPAISARLHIGFLRGVQNVYHKSKAVLFAAVFRPSPYLQRQHKGGFMICYQVLAKFAFCSHKPVLVSTSLKSLQAPAHLVVSGLPFGHGLKYRRFFATAKEAMQYLAHLYSVYANRTISIPASSGGQLYLFQDVSK